MYKIKEHIIYDEFYKFPVDNTDTVNTYNNTFFRIYDTYKVIWLSRNKNPLYRTLKNKDIKEEELAIAISSLITKLLITYSKIDDIDGKIDFAKKSGIDTLSNALLEYTSFRNKQPLINCGEDIRKFMNYINL